MRSPAWKITLGSLILIVAAMALVGTGCPKTSTYSPLGMQVDMELPVESLRLELYGYVDRFSGIVEVHADSIIAATDDPLIRRRARLWKMNAIPACQKAAFQYDPLAGYVDVWVLCKQMSQYFDEGGNGDDLFGEWQPIAVEAAQMAIADIETSFRLAADLDDDMIKEDTRRNVDQFVDEHPMDNLLFVRTSTGGLLAKLTNDANRGTFAAMGRMEQSLGDLTDRMNIYASHLPDQARWQAELAVEDILGGAQVQETLYMLDEWTASLDLTAANVAAVSETIDDQVDGALELVPAEIEAALAEIDRQRLETIAVLRAERELIFEFVHQQRQETLVEIGHERVAVMQDMERVVLLAIDESKGRVEEIIDVVMWRITLLGAIALAALLVFGLIALRVLRPVRS